MYLSLPYSSIILGEVPVVLATVFKPPDLNPEAIKRTTLDLPLEPLTWILIGILDKLFLWILNSITPRAKTQITSIIKISSILNFYLIINKRIYQLRIRPTKITTSKTFKISS